ncbi:Gfo/Idh/MocA family protein [Phnomibacter ginsenosidimutans]|nr:Gfo/Idh/MocA family oxidoreductase [Phnomibacter ginsenosidimutans]
MLQLHKAPTFGTSVRDTPMNKTLHFGLIGCGRIAARHADIMQQYGKLVAVCDIDEPKAIALAAAHGAQSFTCHTNMLSAMAGQLDVVVVCSPNGLHPQHSIDSLQSGCHVLCEKPMSFTREEANAMMDAAETAGKQLWVVKQNRYNPPVMAVKQLLEEGKLGKILNVQLNCFWNRPESYYANSWKGTLDLDGGTLYTQFSHFIDLLVWFFGPFHPSYVQLANLQHQGVIEFEDTGIVAGHFDCGAMGSIHYTVNAYRQNMEGSITIFGEKGTIKIGGQYLNELDYQQLEGEPITGLPAGNPPNQYGNYTGSMSNHPLVYEAITGLLLKNGHGQLLNTSAEAAEAVAVIENIYCMAGRSFKPLQPAQVASR